MADTLTLKTEELIQALRYRAARHREQAQHHPDPEMGEFYAHLAGQCDDEARLLEDKLVRELVQTDPYALAMAAAGATEVKLGRADARENGPRPAPRSATLRSQWPHGEIKAAAARPQRWPF